MSFFDALHLPLLRLLVTTVLALACAAAWVLCNKPRFLAWQSAALGLAAMGQAWLWNVDTSSHALAWMVPGVACVGAAAAMSQATASRLGQPRAMRWGLAGIAGLVVLASIALGYDSIDRVVAWACACVLGQKLWLLWHIPLRHQWERSMLLAHTGCAALLLVYPLVAHLPWMTAGWTLATLAVWALYSVALMTCAWADNPYRGAEVHMDPLTGLMRGAALKDVCEPLPYARGLRVLALCDLDQLQRIRTQHGNTVADNALRSFARVLQSQVREGDHLGRLEGSEFAIVLRHIDLPSAHALATRINQQLAQAPWAQKMAEGPVTASFGIAAILEEDSFDAALHRADVLLYQAQDAGPNHIWVDRPATSELQYVSN